MDLHDPSDACHDARRRPKPLLSGPADVADERAFDGMHRPSLLIEQRHEAERELRVVAALQRGVEPADLQVPISRQPERSGEEQRHHVVERRSHRDGKPDRARPRALLHHQGSAADNGERVRVHPDVSERLQPALQSLIVVVEEGHVPASCPSNARVARGRQPTIGPGHDHETVVRDPGQHVEGVVARPIVDHDELEIGHRL